jgi:hypothetical protein
MNAKEAIIVVLIVIAMIVGLIVFTDLNFITSTIIAVMAIIIGKYLIILFNDLKEVYMTMDDIWKVIGGGILLFVIIYFAAFNAIKANQTQTVNSETQITDHDTCVNKANLLVENINANVQKMEDMGCYENSGTGFSDALFAKCREIYADSQNLRRERGNLTC